jgi:hypothetical protein
MEKTRIWNKDHVKISVGDRVVVFRRKTNGHPKSLKDGKVYKVLNIIGEDIEVEGEGFFKSVIRIKVHKSYLITIDFVRDELISQIIGED